MWPKRASSWASESRSVVVMFAATLVADLLAFRFDDEDFSLVDLADFFGPVLVLFRFLDWEPIETVSDARYSAGEAGAVEEILAVDGE